MDYLKQARGVIQLEIEALQSITERLDENFSRAIEILLETTQTRGKIVVIGIGKSGNIGHKIAATFNSTGAPSVVLNSQNALHGDLGLVSDGDAIIALSQSGETSELIALLPFLKRFELKIIAVTAGKNSTLAIHADEVIDSSVPREACPLNLAPTSSSTAMLAIGDALAMVLLEARGFNEEDFARFHPGGALGHALLTQVSDIMRSGEAMASVPVHATVQETLDEMAAKRSGACLILDENCHLCGIFTHGDFARSYRNDIELGRRPVKNFMTKNPISVPADSLAAEAVKTVGDRRVDDIVVLDTNGHPVGLIDSQDFARHRLI